MLRFIFKKQLTADHKQQGHMNIKIETYKNSSTEPLAVPQLSKH